MRERDGGWKGEGWRNGTLLLTLTKNYFLFCFPLLENPGGRRQAAGRGRAGLAWREETLFGAGEEDPGEKKEEDRKGGKARGDRKTRSMIYFYGTCDTFSRHIKVDAHLCHPPSLPRSPSLPPSLPPRPTCSSASSSRTSPPSSSTRS